MVTRSIAGRLRALDALGGYEGLRDQSLSEVIKVIAQELVYLETVQLSRADRARIAKAIRELDEPTWESIRHAQDVYLAEIGVDDGDATDDVPSKSNIDASESKIDS